MDLPLLLQMELELSVAAHKRDLKEAFAKARERLVPVENHGPSIQAIYESMQNYQFSMYNNYAQQAALLGLHGKLHPFTR